MVHDKPQRADSRCKPTAERAALATVAASGGEQAPARTKRAQLIGMLERPEGASVAEVGQRLGTARPGEDFTYDRSDAAIGSSQLHGPGHRRVLRAPVSRQCCRYRRRSMVGAGLRPGRGYRLQ